MEFAQFLTTLAGLFVCMWGGNRGRGEDWVGMCVWVGWVACVRVFWCVYIHEYLVRVLYVWHYSRPGRDTTHFYVCHHCSVDVIYSSSECDMTHCLVCCSVLQCDAVCRSVLQCVAVLSVTWLIVLCAPAHTRTCNMCDVTHSFVIRLFRVWQTHSCLTRPIHVWHTIKSGVCHD